MAATQTEFASDELAGRCACCGQERPEDRMVRLHSNDEVAVCFPCLDWLNRQRSQKRRELFRAALPGWVPDLPRLRRDRG